MPLLVCTNNPTQGGTDGTPITMVDNFPAMILSQDRGNSTGAVRCALRAYSETCALATLTVIGKSSNKVELSLDGVNFTNKIVVNKMIQDQNECFWVRTSFEADAVYGDDNTCKLHVEYFREV